MTLSNVIIDLLKVAAYVIYMRMLLSEKKRDFGLNQPLLIMICILSMLPGSIVYLPTSFIVVYRILLATFYVYCFYGETIVHSIYITVLTYSFTEMSQTLGAVLTYPVVAIGNISLYTYPAEGILVLMQLGFACIIGIVVMKRLKLLLQRISKGAQVGLTLIGGLIEYALIIFRNADYDTEYTILYQVLFGVIIIATIILILWIIDKHEEQKKIQDITSYSHRTREVIPTLGRALKRFDSVSGYSEMESQLIEEILSVFETDQRQTRKEAANIKTCKSTGIILLDEQFNRYLEEAAAEGFEMDIIVVAPADTLIDQGCIGRFELLQVIGDLYRNAFCVINNIEDGRILLCLGFNSENFYEISIYDNGPLFPEHVLSNLGKRGVTTGGTGHGMADIFAALQNGGISFTLEQKLPGNSIFTKGIHITFDGLNRKDIIKRQ